MTQPAYTSRVYSMDRHEPKPAKKGDKGRARIAAARERALKSPPYYNLTKWGWTS